MKHPKRLFAGVAALALTASGAVVAVRALDGGVPATAVLAKTGTASKTPGELSAAEQAARKKAVDAVLARRAAAVRKGDLRGFLAPVDPKQAELVARQRLLFTNLRKFGFATLQYFTADAFQDSPALVEKFGMTAFSTRVMMHAIEAIGPRGRYFRSWISDRLDGEWRPLAVSASNSFAPYFRQQSTAGNAGHHSVPSRS